MPYLTLKHQLFHPYQKYISIFVTKTKDNVACYNLSGSRTVTPIKSSRKNWHLCKHGPLQNFWKYRLTGLYSFSRSFKIFYVKVSHKVTLKEAGNKEDLKTLLILSHMKLANVSTLSLINLAGISETWEAFFVTFFLFIPWKDWMIDINSFSPHKWYCFQLFVLVFLTHCTKKIPVKKFFNKWANPHITKNKQPYEAFLGKSVLKVCGKFIREHPCRSAISIKLQSN